MRAHAAQPLPCVGRVWVCWLLALAWCGAAAADGEARSLEAQVKAEYLYKFAGHVEWPPGTFADATAPFTIGVVGGGDVADELVRLKAGRRVNDRPVEVRVLKAGDAVRGVHIVFVGGVDAAQLRRLLEPYRVGPTMVVCDVPGAMDAGSVINFMLVDKRIRFEVSLINAEQHGLKVSARLLSVAQRVDSGRRE